MAEPRPVLEMTGIVKEFPGYGLCRVSTSGSSPARSTP